MTTNAIRLVARVTVAAKDEFEARETLQQLLQGESTVESAAITVGTSFLGSGDYGGRDLTFPDGSEGGYWVEPQGYTVKVDIPNQEMLELVLDMLHHLPDSKVVAELQRRRRRGDGPVRPRAVDVDA